MPANRSAALCSNLPRLQPHRSGIIGAWLIGSAFIALVLACLPIGTGASSAGMLAPAIPSPASLGGTVSNSALKGDRLPKMRHGVERMEGNKPANIPTGCEAAFSKLVRVGNFSSRCVT
jgi:hypothetical protein